MPVTWENPALPGLDLPSDTRAINLGEARADPAKGTLMPQDLFDFILFILRRLILF